MTDKRLVGLYVIADTAFLSDASLIDSAASAIEGGTSIVQYRDKRSDHRRRLEQARKLRCLCAKSGVLFIVNDDIEIAAKTGADGVHLGAGDAGIVEARRQLGEKAVIGASCYNSLEQVRSAIDEGADYVALGSVYRSPTKSEATRVDLDTIIAARAEFRLPIACIGGITAENAGPVVDAGADMLAVMSGVFGQPDITAAARNLARLFNSV
ncbi:MAG: thiamine phosphate synthase [Gammaproteobacteria bacterium]